MNTIMRTILVSALTCALGSGVAMAGPNNPPKDSGRNVIADAAAICGGAADDWLVRACDIVSDSNGGLIDDGACDISGGAQIDGDNGQVDYQGRNCDKNEAALVRKASSAVLSLSDLIYKNKQQQAASAAGYLCTFEDGYNSLIGLWKLVPEAGVDLGADASDLADDVMDMVGYCDYLDSL